MSNIAIHVENLGKRYRIGERRRYKALRDTLTNALYAPVRAATSLLNGHHTNASNNDGDNQFWSLKDVSFDVKQGEAVGVIGRNGAGKSTMLKILSRITKPTEGYIRIRGRVGSLLEVGTGFHPELTGRENAYLNGAIIGMKKKEIDRKFDEIVAFAEIEKFIDTPVKFYSSGMYIRLAFAVAAHLEPEILLVDEVLAVGDAAFQKKCLGKMGDVTHAGRTVLFVSHNLSAIQTLCQRTIWLDGGRIEADGKPEQTVANYLNRMLAREDVRGVLTPLGDLQIQRIRLKNSYGEVTTNFRVGEPLLLEIHYSCAKAIEYPYFWVSIGSQCGSHFAANMLLDGCRTNLIQGNGILSCRFEYLPLLPQRYIVQMGVRDKTGKVMLVSSGEVAAFNVINNVTELGLKGEQASSFVSDATPVLVPYEWNFADGKIVSIDPLKAVQIIAEE